MVLTRKCSRAHRLPAGPPVLSPGRLLGCMSSSHSISSKLRTVKADSGCHKEEATPWLVQLSGSVLCSVPADLLIEWLNGAEKRLLSGHTNTQEPSAALTDTHSPPDTSHGNPLPLVKREPRKVPRLGVGGWRSLSSSDPSSHFFGGRGWNVGRLVLDLGGSWCLSGSTHPGSPFAHSALLQATFCPRPQRSGASEPVTRMTTFSICLICH